MPCPPRTFPLRRQLHTIPTDTQPHLTGHLPLPAPTFRGKPGMDARTNGLSPIFADKDTNMEQLAIGSLGELPKAAEAVITASGGRGVVAFFGAMGAGKTTLIREICTQLGVADNVTSPTFALVNHYRSGRGGQHLSLRFLSYRKVGRGLRPGLRRIFRQRSTLPGRVAGKNRTAPAVRHTACVHRNNRSRQPQDNNRLTAGQTDPLSRRRPIPRTFPADGINHPLRFSPFRLLRTKQCCRWHSHSPRRRMSAPPSLTSPKQSGRRIPAARLVSVCKTLRYTNGSFTTSALSSFSRTLMYTLLPTLENSGFTYPMPIPILRQGDIVPDVTTPILFPSASAIS